MTPLPDEVCVLLSPRQVGGHEHALAAWLGDAVRRHGLRPRIVAPATALRACFGASAAARGLDPVAQGWRGVGAALRRWPVGRPLLLCPGSLHSHPALLAAALACRHQVWLYVPSLHDARTMRARLAGWRDAWVAPLLRQTRRWIVLSDAQAADLHSRWGVTPDEVVVLPNLSRLGGEPPPAPAPDAQGRLRVAFVGRFDANGKGLDWLAATLLADPDWARRHQWHFQGEGPARGLLEVLAARLGPDCVRLHAHGPVDAAFARADVLLLCSRFEGQPLVALEALQRGWPVVASSRSGLGDILPSAALFEFGDAAGLARALALAGCARRRAAWVAEGRRRHDAAGVRARYEQALAELVLRWRGGRRAG